MPENTSLGGLEYEIKAVSSGAEQNINKISDALKGLKSSVDTNIGGAISALNQLNQAFNSLTNSPIHKLSESLKSLSGLNQFANIKIPDSFGESFSKALSGINIGDFQDKALSVSESFVDIAEYVTLAVDGLGNFTTYLNAASKAMQGFSQNTSGNIFQSISGSITSFNTSLSSLNTDDVQAKVEKIVGILNTSANGKLINQLGMLANSSNTINASNLNSVGQALYNISQNSQNPIPNQFVDNLVLLDGISREIDTERIAGLATALGSFKSIGEIKFPSGFISQLRILANTMANFDETRLQTLTAVGTALSSFSSLKDVKLSPTFAGQIPKIIESVRTVTDADIKRLNALSNALKNLGAGKLQSLKVKINTSDLTKASSKIKSFQSDSLQNFKTMGSGMQSIFSGMKNIIVTPIKGAWDWIKGSLGEPSVSIGQNLKDMFISPLQGAWQLTKGIAQVSKGMLGLSMNVSSKLAPVLKQAFIAPLKYAGKLSVAIGQSLLAPITRVANRLKVVIAGFAKIVKLRAFRFIITSIVGGIKEGRDNLYQFSKAINGEFASSMDKLSTSMLYFKNSVGASLAPLINAAAPAIDLFVDKIVEATNSMNKFFAQMTGASTWTKALKYPKEYAEAVGDKTADAVDKAKDAMQSFTMGFDELNIISDDKADKSKAVTSDKDANELDYSKMFEIQNLEPNAWVQQLKDAIDSGDWLGAGTLLGEKFNSIFENIDFKDFGEKLGTKINNAISLAKGFLDTSDFSTVGKGIAETLNSGFEQIDFYNLGSVLTAKFNFIIDTVNGFVKNFNFSEFGKNLSQAVNGFVDSIHLDTAVEDALLGLGGVLDTAYNLLDGIDFQAATDKISSAFNNLVAGLPDLLGKFGRTASKFATSVFTTLSSTLEGIDWENTGANIFNGIKELFENIEWDKVSSSFAEFLGSAIGAGVSLISGFIGEAQAAYDQLFNWLSSGNVDPFQEALKWTDGNFVKPLLQGIVTNMESEEAWNDIQSVIEEKGSMWDFWQGFGEYIYDEWHKGSEGVYEFNKSIEENKNTSKGWGEWWQGYGAEVFDTITEYKENFLLAIDSIKQGFSNFVSSVEENGYVIYDSIQDLKQGWTDFWDTWSVGLDDFLKLSSAFGTGFLEGIAKPFKTIGTWIKTNIYDPFVNGFKDKFEIHSPSKVMSELGGYLIDGLKNGITDAWDGIKEWIDEHIFQPFTSGFKTLFGINSPSTVMHEQGDFIGQGLKNGITEALSDIKTFIAEKIFSPFTDAFDEFKTSWSAGWDSAKDKFSEFKDNWASGAVSLKESLSDLKGNWSSGWGEIKDNLSGIFSTIKNEAGNLFSPVAESFKSGANSVIGFIEGMVNNIIFAFNSMGRVMNSFSVNIPSWVPGIGGGTLNFNFPEWSEIGLGRFDKGGFPNSGDLFFANENGHPEFVGSMGSRTAVANNDQITEGIYEAVYAAMTEVLYNQNGEQQINLNVYLDGKEIGSRMEERKQSRGKTLFTGGVVNEF